MTTMTIEQPIRVRILSVCPIHGALHFISGELPPAEIDLFRDSWGLGDDGGSEIDLDVCPSCKTLGLLLIEENGQ